jgi:hypothetical protein
MNYKVIWRPRCVRKLTEYYLRALEQGESGQDITDATAEVDSRIGRYPRTQGESRLPGERLLIVTPLVVLFEVYEEEKIVVVTGVRYYQKR